MASLKGPSQKTGRRRWPRFLLIIVLVGTGLGLGWAIALAWYSSTGLPSLAVLHEYQPSLITKVHADNGQVMGQFYVERRILARLTEVPQHLINALIAARLDYFHIKEAGLCLMLLKKLRLVMLLQILP